MHSAFNIVIWGVSLLAVVIAFGALIASRKTWEDFGKGQFVMDREQPRKPVGAPRSPSATMRSANCSRRATRAGPVEARGRSTSTRSSPA